MLIALSESKVTLHFPSERLGKAWKGSGLLETWPWLD